MRELTYVEFTAVNAVYEQRIQQLARKGDVSSLLMEKINGEWKSCFE